MTHSPGPRSGGCAAQPSVPSSPREAPGEVSSSKGSEAAPHFVTVTDCLAVVEQAYRVSRLDLLSHRRPIEYARPRQVAMWLARHCTLRTLPQIGRVMLRDHTTILHGISTIERLRGEDPELRAVSDSLRQRLSGDTQA